VIEFRNVGKTYRSVAGLGRTVRAVDGVTLTIGQGEVVGLAGPNGAGKTTLIAMMLGYLQPSDGDVRIAGQTPRAYVERNGIGYLSELIAIRQHWTAEGALRRFGILAGISEENLRPRVNAVIERLGLEEHRDKRIKALSKGNLQRVGLAQALLQEDASVMVLDEPTHGLDPVWTQRFRDVVGELRAPGRAIFIASHNLDELERLCDRVAIIDHGQLQRVVTMRGLDRSTPATSFTLTMVSGAEHVPTIFPGAVALGHGEFQIAVADHAMLNRGIADLLNRGAMLASVTPSQSSLEQQFRQAVGE
jgi:ABC-2 type transport system ATP-binding protein